MEKANEYAVESLKQIITLAGGILALTITFLKDVLGENRSEAVYRVLVPVGWLCLIVSIVLAWVAIVEAADALASSAPGSTTPYAFQTDKTGNRRSPYPFFVLSSLFLPFIPTQENNKRRKIAASAQHYFIFGLIFLGLFAAANLNTAFHKTPPVPSEPVKVVNATPTPTPLPSPTPNTVQDVTKAKSRCRCRPRRRR